MYMHAFSFPKASDEVDAEEDKKFHRINREAAGVWPRAPLEFIERVKTAVGGRREQAKWDYAKLAHRLNGKGILDAKGNTWTPTSLEAFVARFIISNMRWDWPPQSKRQSNIS
jgi:hypothetical protein